MELSFVRTGERGATILVERDDGVRLRISNPGSPGGVPHDLVHYAVESELGLERGFWGEVARGRDFGGEVLAAPPGLKHRRPRSDGPGEVGEAEVLVRILFTIWNGQAVREWAPCAFLDAQPSPRTRSRAEELDAATIGRVCGRIGELESSWRALPDGGELKLHWPAPVGASSPAAPRRSRVAAR